MFMNKKIKAVVAMVSAAATIMFNSISAFAMPYAAGSAEDIRSKALNSYLSANKVIAMVGLKAPSLENGLEFTDDDALVTYATVAEVEAVSYTTIKRLNTTLGKGETITVREGVPGVKTVTYNVKYENGEEVSREAVDSLIVTNPVSKIVEYGAEGDYYQLPQNTTSTDTSKLNYKYYIDCQATAYDMSAEENGGYAGQTATGVPLDKGVIAVDPRVIPLGSRVYIEAIDGSWSYGYAVAADTGGAIKGKRVDLCYRTRYECIQFGRRPCRVYVLN